MPKTQELVRSARPAGRWRFASPRERTSRRLGIRDSISWLLVIRRRGKVVHAAGFPHLIDPPAGGPRGTKPRLAPVRHKVLDFKDRVRCRACGFEVVPLYRFRTGSGCTLGTTLVGGVGTGSKPPPKGLAHVASPAARRRPDKYSSRCSRLRNIEPLATTIGVMARNRVTTSRASSSRPIWA